MNSFYTFIANFVLVGCLLASGTGNAQKSVNVKEFQLSISFNEASAATVFKQIEEQTNFNFVYTSNEIKSNKLFTASYQKESLYNILLDISREMEIGFRRINDNINVRKLRFNDKESYIELEEEFVITGSIKDDAGEAIVGASIVIKGTAKGTITDVDGNFSLEVNEGDQLIIAFIGYQSKEIAVSNQTSIDVVMEYSVDQLEDVVVVGFGEKARRDLTSSISTVNAEAIGKISTASSQFALQGNATGVRVVQASGNPNDQPKIFVRGVGTWQGSAQPLYVVDGQIILPQVDFGNQDVIGAGGRTPPNFWTTINPNDIESISVLKDASAAAIYGSRAANGVILITTKKGKYGAPSIEFNAEKSWANAPRAEFLNTQQYIDITNEMFANNENPSVTIENQLYGRNELNDQIRLYSFSPQFDPLSPYYINPATAKTYDWQDELIRKNALTENYDLKMSGANDQTDYYFSFGYNSRDATFVGNELKRYTASLNLNSEVNSWLKAGITARYTHQDNNIQDGMRMPAFVSGAPWQPIFDPTNEFGFAPSIDPSDSTWVGANLYGASTRSNLLAQQSLNQSKFIYNRMTGNGHLEITPLKGLSLRGGISFDLASQNRRSVGTRRAAIFSPRATDPSTTQPAANSLGSFGERKNDILNYQADFSATYDRSFGDHRITATGVVQDTRRIQDWDDYSTLNLGYIPDDLNNVGYGNDLANNTSIHARRENFWFGYALRFNYNYNSKYYLDASWRRDASNGFAKEYRWGDFYSVSGAWRISHESFVQIPFINDLKLRGGFGQAGNDEAVVGSFAYLSRVGGAGSYSFGSGNGNYIGNYTTINQVAGFPNPELQWEVSETAYIGLDALMLDNKISVTTEFYKRTTKGIQQLVNLPLIVGTSDPFSNIGELVNKGLDLSIGYGDRKQDFTYNISGNISFVDNEVTKIYNQQPLTTNAGRVEEGRSIGHIWGYKMGGIFQTQAEVDAYQALIADQFVQDPSRVRPGDAYFLDIGGNPTAEEMFYSTIPDSILNSFDQTEIGKTIAGFTYGINLSAGWKGFDLSLSFYGEGDVDRVNDYRRSLESMSGASANFSATVLNRWTPENKSSSMTRAVYGDPAGNNRLSDRFVESAAYFRLNNWQLGYTIPDVVLSKINYAVKSLRIYIGGSNNLYLFKWSGLDPVNDDYPLAKSFNVGLRSKF